MGGVIGNYRLIRKLGEGGMGAVYLAEHTLLGRRAALKMLLPMLGARPDVMNWFFNEARTTTAINDPGIVQIFDFGYAADGCAYIVMEFLEGESLAAAHARGIVHCNLKPDNIYLVRDAEVASGERPKILDFGPSTPPLACHAEHTQPSPGHPSRAPLAHFLASPLQSM